MSESFSFGSAEGSGFNGDGTFNLDTGGESSYDRMVREELESRGGGGGGGSGGGFWGAIDDGLEWVVDAAGNVQRRSGTVLDLLERAGTIRRDVGRGRFRFKNPRRRRRMRPPVVTPSVPPRGVNWGLVGAVFGVLAFVVYLARGR